MGKIIRFITAFVFLCLHNKGVGQISAIKGTWVTNVASSALSSPGAISETVDHCKRNGLTDVFVVVWNRGVTMYPSQVVKKYIGIEQDTAYKGFDPLRLFIENGHKAGLRIHAWFEFGFSYAYQDSSQAQWLNKYPAWAGRDNQGRLLKKNNFFWWNSLHPEVQQFMQELVMEVVKNYDVDGIQGDDRLPAMPAEGGYDDYTLRLYAAENNGKSPPANPKEPNWLQWKADRLSAFVKELY
ncbi:MAG: family 10 glycosylhydrolase, partial [Chitinophagaceae bacterium]|nr:family 10 glycosylhydrolase [Chitinophagaceae bacterium]